MSQTAKEAVQKSAQEPAQDKEYALFLGCVIPIQLPQFEKLARDILPQIGIKLVDFNFTCCPYQNGVRDVDEDEWLVVAARNLAVAEESKHDIVTICNGCSQTLIEANHILKNDRDIRDKVNEELKKVGMKYKGTINAYNFMMLLDENKDKIQSLIKTPLNGLKIATHAGCHLLKPSKIIGYDDAEHPHKFDDLVEVLGCSPMDYENKTLCCGYSQINRNMELSLNLLGEKLTEIHDKNIDAVAVACPSCYIQMDKNQAFLRKTDDGLNHKVIDYKFPVVHVLQLMGLAMGMTPKDVFLSKNSSVTKEFTEKVLTVLK